MNLVQVEYKSNQLEVIEQTQSLVVKDICEAIGIDFTRQYRKLKSDSTFQSSLIKVKTPGGIQEVFCIPLSKLNGWLFSINPNKVKPEVRERLIEYKNECFEVLYKHFNKIPQDQNLQILNTIQSMFLKQQEILDSFAKKINSLENSNQTKISKPLIQMANKLNTFATLTPKENVLLQEILQKYTDDHFNVIFTSSIKQKIADELHSTYSSIHQLIHRLVKKQFLIQIKEKRGWSYTINHKFLTEAFKGERLVSGQPTTSLIPNHDPIGGNLNG